MVLWVMVLAGENGFTVIAEDGIVLPRPSYTVAPQYPDALSGTGKFGTVKLRVSISAEGRVEQVEVLSSFDPAVTESAIIALKQWKFEPGIRDGTPVPMQVVIPLQFVDEKPQVQAVVDKILEMFGRNPFIILPEDAVVVKLSDLANKPMKWIHQNRKPSPRRYPVKYAGTATECRASVSYVIGPDGIVYNPKVIEIENEDFRLAALQTLSLMQFNPVKHKGSAAYVLVETPMMIREHDTPPVRRPARGMGMGGGMGGSDSMGGGRSGGDD